MSIMNHVYSRAKLERLMEDKSCIYLYHDRAQIFVQVSRPAIRKVLDQLLSPDCASGASLYLSNSMEQTEQSVWFEIVS